MTIRLPNTTLALVVNANIAIAVASREAGRDVRAKMELHHYSNQGYEWYAPGIMVA